MPDIKTPKRLLELQQWFGSIISRPIDEESRINPTSPSGQAIEEEASYFITPSPTLKPHQRVEIYNQQYWWRLLSILHDIFPLVTRLFGYRDFNQVIGFPFLSKYPPDTWTLNSLGARLPEWIENDYQASDKGLVTNASRIDLAYNDDFVAAGYPPLSLDDLPSPEEVASLLSKTLYLQPFVTLFDMEYDLFTFREEMLCQDPDHWLKNDFPELKKDKHYYFTLFRNRKNNVIWEQVDEGEYFLLNLFAEGATIEGAIEQLERTRPDLAEMIAASLAAWFQKWALRGIITLHDPS